MIPQEYIQEVVRRNDIEEVIGQYVQLRRRGRTATGLCPFHNEKTPSFVVYPDTQSFYCFGCGAAGDVINFVRKYNNLGYVEAVKQLAGRAGMPLPEEDDRESRARQRLLEINRCAARYFYENLNAKTPEAAMARRYWKEKRGLSDAAIRRFGLGYAPEDFGGLLHYLKRRGFREEELETSGLVKRSAKGNLYDIFRHRVMVPIIDVRGAIIAFGGRVLDDSKPKYINSPETMVYHKSRTLFALNIAKKSKNRRYILCEGYMDVISMHEAGFDTAVCACGTALTPEQAKLLSEYADEVVLSYDSDEAGQKATERSLGILGSTTLKVSVLSYQGAKDPDEFIKAKGAEAFQNLLAESENHVEYRLDAVKAKYDLGTDEGKVGYLKDAAAVLAELPDRAAREVYAMRAASLCGVSPEAVQDEIKQLRRRKAASARRKDEREQLRPVRMSQPQAQGIRYENPRSAAAEQGVIRLLYIDPELFRNVELGEGDFSSKELWQIYSARRRHVDGGGKLSPAALSGELTAEEASLFTSLIQSPESAANGKRALADYIAIMREGPRNTASTPEELMELAGRMKKTKSYGG